MIKNRLVPYWPVMWVLMSGALWGQIIPPATLVSIPTAGTMQKGEYEIELLMQTGGGLLGRAGVGLTDRISLGLSYGVQKFIGDQAPELNRVTPETQVKIRVMDETYSLPAVALGLDSQGRGRYQIYEVQDSAGQILETLERYEIKAIGFYAVVSKNWQILGNFGSHFGLCKNLWEADSRDDDINFFLGIDKDIASSISLFAEYNATLDDNNYDDDELIDLAKITVGQGRGYLNAGLRWHLAPNFFVEVDLNDILLNKGKVEHFNRELKVVFNDFF